MLAELQGREFDWYAIDSVGNFALFSTAGWGFIPAQVSRQFAQHDTVSESILSPRWGSKDAWKDYADLGLYVFDWDSSCYKKCVVPNVAIPPELRELILKIADLPSYEGTFVNIQEISAWTCT